MTDEHRDKLRCQKAVEITVLSLIYGCVVWFASAAQCQVLMQNRITAPIRSSQRQILHGTVSPVIAQARDQGPLSGSTLIPDMAIVFRRSAAQQASLEKLLQAQQTKGSPMYHQWLTPKQFAATYGVSQSDLAQVSAWLQSQGFSIVAIPPSSDRIEFSGTAAQVNAAFQTQLHRYVWNGIPEWANATDISVPQAIAPVALTVERLNTFRPLPRNIRRPVRATVHGVSSGMSPHYTVSDQNGNELNFIAPSDSATIYDIDSLYSQGVTGKGQYIGIAGQTDITQYQSDIANFRSLSGLNASNLPTQILVPNSGSAQVYAGDLEEADIDVEWSGAIAKDASILFITVGSDQNASVFNSLEYAIQNPLINNNTQVIPVLSISYGACEEAYTGSGEIAALEQVLQQANAQGQTVFASSGDSGSADCDTGTNSSGQVVAASGGLAVDYPGSSQYVTAAGGTSFSADVNDQSKYWSTTNNTDNGSALGYIPETTWNDTPSLAGLQSAGSLSASGGGASSCIDGTGTPPNANCTAGFLKPSWQAGPGVPGDGHRDVPDLSLAADPNHDGYVLCTEETNTAGTSLTGTSSCVYPVGSGQVPYFDANNQGYLYGGTSIAAPQLAAMITLMNQKAGNTNGIGNINPIVYLAAQSNPGAFHDVTTGSNAVVCQQGSPNCVASGSGYVMSCCNAGSGYDQATGLGSIDVSALAAIWPSVVTTNANFSLVSSPGAISVAPGGSASTTLALTALGSFSGTVTLACSGLPTGTSCAFAPGSSVNLASGTTQNVTVTISATSSAKQTSPASSHSGWPMRAAMAGVFSLTLIGIGRKRKLFPTGWMAILMLVCGLAVTSLLTACSGGSSSSGSGGTPTPPASTGTITVTATSGASTATTKIQLTIS